MQDELSSLSPWGGALALGVAGLLLSPVLLRLGYWLACRVDDALRPLIPSPARRLPYLAFGALCALGAAACGWRYGSGPTALMATLFVLWMATLAWIDGHTGLLPDTLTLTLLWCGLLVNLNHVFVPLADAVIGAAAGYLFFWVVYQVFLLLTGREGLGHGDFKLLAAVGAWLGWTALPNIVLMASVSALAVTLARRWRSGDSMSQVLHYGPYLAAAGVAQLFWTS